MSRRVLVIDGHPDPAPQRLCHALVQAYADGVRAGGGEARVIELSGLDVPFLRSERDFGAPPENADIVQAREAMLWADHIALIFPLWLGSAPALVRAFFEQVARANFVAETAKTGWHPRLKGKSARLIVTMGMPAFIYQSFFGGHGVSSWRKSILGFAGVGPIRTTLFGAVAAANDGEVERRLARVRALGARD